MKFTLGKKILFFSLVCFLFLFVPAVPAATSGASVGFMRYLLDPVPEEERSSQKSVRVVEGTKTFRVRFEPDENLCRKKYGKEWNKICARSVGDIVPKTNAITMKPEHPGRWEWDSSTELIFYPSEPWPADTPFNVKIGKESLPKYTEITEDIYFRTRPVSTSMQADFKFDPEQYKNMMISGTVRFNYPMDKESVLKRFVVEVPTGSASSGLLLGEKTTSFNPSSSILYFSTPVLKMPDTDQSIIVRVNRGIKAVSGGTFGVHNAKFAKVPAKNSIFKLLSDDTNIISMPDLSAKQTFTFEFSLPVLPKDVLALSSIYLMPRERVQSMTDGETASEREKKSPYRWWSLAEVTDEILKEATSLPVELLSKPDVPTRFVTFALKKDEEAKRYIYFVLKDKLAGPDDFVLPTSYHGLMSVPSLRGAMQIMQQGAILSLGGEKKLALYARNADEINYEVSQIRPEFLSLYVANMGSDLSHTALANVNKSALSIVTEGIIPLTRKNAEEAQFTSLDLEPFLKGGKKGLFQVLTKSLLDGDEQYTDTRFVMLTDIGLIRKENVDGTSLVYVVSLADGKPMRNVRVQVLGKNGIAIFEGHSDRKGVLFVPDLRAYAREKKPTALVAQIDEDIAFLPFNDSRRELDVQRFKVSGKSHVDDGVYGFIFTQRDLYRPGESAYFGIILKQGDFDSTKLKDMPLQAYLHDPRGNIFDRKKMQITDTGLGDINFVLPKNAQTGLYTLYVKNSENSETLLSKTFNVEEFQADTLRLDVDFDLDTKEAMSPKQKAKKVWFLPSELKVLGVDIKLMNLFGTPAAGNLIRANAEIHPGYFSFAEYADWRFFNAAVLEKSNNLDLGTRNTDEHGKASFVVDSSLYENSTALLRVTADAFEPDGGNFVQRQTNIIVSPLQAVIGWKSTSNIDYIPQNDEAYLEIIALDSMAQPYDYGSFTWDRYDVDYVRSLVKDNRGEFRYSKERKETLVESTPIKLPAKAIKLALNTKESGEKMLVAKDSEGRIVLRVSYTVAGDALAQFGESKNPDFRAKLNKTDYARGEKMKIYMNLPYDGAGLITIERDKVFMQEWFTGKRGERVHEIRLSDNFEGKAYVNILYFRDLQDEDIFTKPSANVVLPFTANLKARALELNMEIVREKQSRSIFDFSSKKEEITPFVARPGAEFAVKITSNKAGKAIVYAVDEGILQMTGYRTPDPLAELLVQRALEVRTYQYFDLLMPEYSLLQGAIPAFGGGLAMGSMNAAANPFRRKGQEPAVFWSGLVDVNEDGTVVNIPVPATFNGQLRVIAVACSTETVASVQEDVLVQAEVVMQPSLPFFLAPGDAFDVTLSLTDMRIQESLDKRNDADRTVDFAVDLSPALEFVEDPPAKIALLYTKQKTLTLRLRVKTEKESVSSSGKKTDAPPLSVLGEQEITFKVHVTGDKAGAVSTITMPTSLSVRPLQAKQTRLKMELLSEASTAVKVNQDTKFLETILPFERKIYPQFAEVSASLSPLPLPFIQALVQMLGEYPYPCTEQYTSKALPLLTLLRHPRFAPEGEEYTEKALQEEIITTLQVLASRYRYDGSFSMWPSGYGKTSLLHTVYAADFVTEAIDMGISVPSELRVNLLQRLESTLSSTPDDLEDARAYAYGAWVLTRNGIITSNILANLVAWLDSNVKNWQKDIVAPFMAASMKLMMQEEAARKLLDAYVPDALGAWAWSSSLDGLAQRSLYLTVLAKHFPEMLAEEKGQQAMAAVLTLTVDQKYVTLSAAQAARALILYSLRLEKEVGAGEQSLRFLDADGKGIVLPSNQAEEMSDSMIASKDAAIISRIAAVEYISSLPSFYSLTSTAYNTGTLSAAASEGMEIIREYRDLEGNILDELQVGDDVIVAIRARSLGGDLSNIVITDLLPGALEFVVAKGGNVMGVSTREGKRMAKVTNPQEEEDMDILYTDRREDRIVLFAELDKDESVFRYRVRVANRGNFAIPPISAESMYNPSVYAASNTALGKQKGRMEIK